MALGVSLSLSECIPTAYLCVQMLEPIPALMKYQLGCGSVKNQSTNQSNNQTQPRAGACALKYENKRKQREGEEDGKDNKGI